MTEQDMPSWLPVDDDPEDDCLAKWRGLMLRAERMNPLWVWWAVYDAEGRTEADCYGDYEGSESRCESMAEARAAAERAALRVLYQRRSGGPTEPLK